MKIKGCWVSGCEETDYDSIFEEDCEATLKSLAEFFRSYDPESVLEGLRK